MEQLTEEQKQEKVDLLGKIMILITDKNLDVDDIKDNYNVESLSDLTYPDTKKLYSEING